MHFTNEIAEMAFDSFVMDFIIIFFAFKNRYHFSYPVQSAVYSTDYNCIPAAMILTNILFIMNVQ